MGMLVRSTHGGSGNFELVVPRGPGGGARHWWRDNGDPAHPWYGPVIAFGSEGLIGGIGLLQGDFGPVGNLEVVAGQGGRLVHTSRDDGVSWGWRTPAPLPGVAAPDVSPAFIQGRWGGRGNYEVVAPLAAGGMGHWWRDNDHPDLPWYGPSTFGWEAAGASEAGGPGPVGAVAMVHGRASDNLELVARVGSRLQHWWRDGLGSWHRGPDIGLGASGVHDLVEGAGPEPHLSNYELVAPLAAGGMGHWSADPKAPALAWGGPTATFGSGQVLAVGLVQGTNGNLEVVAAGPARVEHWWRDGGPPYEWHGPTVIWAQPAFDPARHGRCDIAYDTGTVAIHAALVRPGAVAVWGYGDHDVATGQSHVLDLSTGQVQAPPESHHLFCSGHAFAPDGSVVVTGGHHFDVKGVHRLDPDGPAWSHVADMAQGRWYPTTTALADGRVMAISGSSLGGPLGPDSPANNTIEVFAFAAGPGPSGPLSGGTPGPSGPPVDLPSPWSLAFPAQLPTIDLYPFVFLLPDGRLFVHARHVTRLYDLDNNSWGPEVAAVWPVSRTYPGQGSAVLLALEPPDYQARVLVMGGAGVNPEVITQTTPAVATAEILDLSGTDPAWRETQPMTHARVLADATLLPDGTVVVTGGSASGRSDVAREPVLPIERFDPATETWEPMCELAVPRLYHSTALLLPDGRVLVMGKDEPFNPDPFHYPERRGEAFSPPYLFAGPRPSITTAPAQVGYGSAFPVGTPDAEVVDAARLLRPGSVTHGFNMEQRLVGMEIVARAAGTITVASPPSPNLAPPGWYMLFLLRAGVPSVGQFLRLG